MRRATRQDFKPGTTLLSPLGQWTLDREEIDGVWIAKGEHEKVIFEQDACNYVLREV